MTEKKRLHLTKPNKVVRVGEFLKVSNIKTGEKGSSGMEEEEG